MYVFWYLNLHAYVQINKCKIVYMYVHAVVVYVQFDHLKWSKTSTSTGRNLMVFCDFVNLL